MKLDSFEAIVRALNNADVRYLIAGGLAVNAHGYLRYTKDADIVLQLVPHNIERAFSSLGALGYRPSVPVTSAQFADAETRESWVRDKGMKVLQLWSDNHPETPIDIFVSEPFDFDEEYDHAYADEVAPGLPVRFVRLGELIRMKTSVGRPRDDDDVQHLRWLKEDASDPNEG